MLSVFVNGTRIEYTDLSYSSVDPGGFESCSFASKKDVQFNPGDDVRVFEGSETAWHGRIEEPGLELEYGRAANQVNAVGYGTNLRREPFAMIYVDGDMSNWAPVDVERRRALMVASLSPFDPQVENSASGLPALRLQVSDTWVSPNKPICEAIWNSGPHTTIRRLFFNWSIGTHPAAADANWVASAYFWNEVAQTVIASSTDFQGVSASGTTELSPGVTTNSILVQWYYNATPAGTAGVNFDIALTNFKVFGDHDLLVRSEVNAAGTTVNGLHLSDIVRHILRCSKVGFEVDIDSNNLLVTQFSYREPADAESMVIDAAKLVGWHWGVWEPTTLGSTPRFKFKAPPKNATTFVSISDCDRLDITESLSSLYNEIYLTYTDGFGKQGFTTYRSEHPRIRNGETRRLVVNGGVLNSDAAPAYARYVLLLTQEDSRVSGSCELPTKMYDGRWAHLIRPGLDKLQIFGLGQQQVLGSPNGRFDTFRIRRVSTTATENGTPRTTVEFDRGADLIEVLQARMTQANSSIGF
jgi:hypothetical protein